MDIPTTCGKVTFDGKTLYVTWDEKDAVCSKSGKSILLACTGGTKFIDGVGININVYRQLTVGGKPVQQGQILGYAPVSNTQGNTQD
jgi:hypothetical protein